MAKGVLEGKIIAINAYIKKDLESNLTSHLRHQKRKNKLNLKQTEERK